MIHKDYFFDSVRFYLFGGSLTEGQVAGMERYLDWFDQKNPPLPERYHIDERCLAYIFATMHVETAQTMQPIREYGSISYLKSKPYYPWYGRGDVQLTWQDNYKRQDSKLSAPPWSLFPPGALVKNLDLALDLQVSMHVCILGMYDGDFTGKAFRHFFTDDKTDWYNARTIINGHDRASEIAGYAEKYHNALSQT